MHENGFRHLPVIENGKLIGVVSARNALDPGKIDKAAGLYALGFSPSSVAISSR